MNCSDGVPEPKTPQPTKVEVPLFQPSDLDLFLDETPAQRRSRLIEQVTVALAQDGDRIISQPTYAAGQLIRFVDEVLRLEGLQHG